MNLCGKFYNGHSLAEYHVISFGIFPFDNFEYEDGFHVPEYYEKALKHGEVLLLEIDGNEFSPQPRYVQIIGKDEWEKTRKEMMNRIATNIGVSFESIMNTLEPQKNNNNIPTKVMFNEKKRATTLMFGNQATVVKSSDGTVYDKRIGFLEAYFQARCGLSKTKALKYLDKLVEEKEVKE